MLKVAEIVPIRYNRWHMMSNRHHTREHVVIPAVVAHQATQPHKQCLHLQPGVSLQPAVSQFSPPTRSVPQSTPPTRSILQSTPPTRGILQSIPPTRGVSFHHKPWVSHSTPPTRSILQSIHPTRSILQSIIQPGVSHSTPPTRGIPFYTSNQGYLIVYTFNQGCPITFN